MQNIEYKTRCVDSEGFEARIQAARRCGARYVCTISQIDTYFHAWNGRLKLRAWRDDTGDRGSELIAYHRPDVVDSRLSAYQRLALADPDSAKSLLESALGVRSVVEKERILYLYGATRIHFDTVKRLGSFIELETVLPDSSGAVTSDRLEKEHRAVIAFLELSACEPVTTSYGDLIEQL